MTNEEIAQQLHQDLLGNKAAFSCGCVLEKRTIYPGKDWVRTGMALSPCVQHPSPHHPNTELFKCDPGHSVFLGFESALEQRWITPLGEELSECDLEQAMDDWLWRAGDIHVEWFPGGLRAVPKTKNPWVVSGDRKYLVDRRGQIRPLSKWFATSSWPAIINCKPGDIIDPVTLRKTERIVFDSIVGYWDFSFSKNTLPRTAEKFKETFPTLAKNIEIRASHSMKMTWPDQPLGYAEHDAKLTHQLIEKMGGSPDPQYGTPPQSIPFTTSHERWKEGLEEAGVTVDMAVMGAFDTMIQDLDEVLDAPEDNDE